MGGDDDATDEAYPDALIAAGLGGINLFDTAINYRNQRSERCVGAALRKLQRDEMVVCTKAGFLTPGAVPSFLKPEHVVGGMRPITGFSGRPDRSQPGQPGGGHDRCLLPAQSRDPARFADPRGIRRTPSRRVRPPGATGGRTRIPLEYGAATWDGLRRKGALDLPGMAGLALEECGPEHHFRFVQLPFNLGMVEAFLGSSEGGKRESTLQAAARLGIAVIASATLSQGEALEHMPKAAAELLPGLTNAQRAIQFTRSTPGVAAGLVGMGRLDHVLENLGVAHVAPITHEQYLRLYQ